MSFPITAFRQEIMFYKKIPVIKFLAVFTCVVSISACSNTDIGNKQADIKSIDRFEGFNRKIYRLNNGADGMILRPIAKGYKAITPKIVDTSIGNFFSNLDDVGNVINNSLQGKFADAGSDLERVVFNSTLGFAGLVDIASSVGLKKHDEDFGQTLAKWGVKSGPYVMLPFFGPTTVRDGISRFSVDRATDPTTYSDENIALFIAETVKKRSDLFAQEGVLDDLSDDKYSALRDVWIQNRNFLINDGSAESSSGDDLIDELESL